MNSQEYDHDYRVFKPSLKRKVFTTLYLILFGMVLGVLVTNIVRPVKNYAESKDRRPDTVIAQTYTPAPVLDVSSYENAVIQAANKAVPAVVTVFTTGQIRSVKRFSHPLLDMMWGPQVYRRTVTGMGSGVIVNPDGIIYTNDHVIDIQHATEIRVVLPDGRSFEAELVKRFPVQDVAVLSVDGENLPYIEIDSSSGVRIGQTVLAIGNPFGVGLTEGLKGGEPTVTKGIISAKNRILTIIQGETRRYYRSMFQTDASINEGNSGGALIDLNGKLIGINTAIYQQGAGSIGIGFAIPTDRITFFLESAEKYKDISDWYSGITIQKLTAEIADAFHFKGEGGALVSEIDPGGPGEKSGLKRGDIIIGVNGYQVTTTDEVQNVFHGFIVGETLALTVFRNNQTLTLELTLESYKRKR